MRQTNATMSLSDLIVDYDLYPRAAVDATHVSQMRDAFRAGVVLPPIVADADSKRITDGFHRRRVWAAELGEEAEVAVVLKHYKSEAEMFLDALRLNASHGKALTPFDRARCALKCRKYRVGIKTIASAMGMSVETVKAIGEGRVAKVKGASKADHGSDVALKRTIEHMSGRTLTDGQHDANKRLSGMRQVFYVNQVLLLIENDLIDTDDATLMDAIAKLQQAIDGLLCAA